MKNVKLITKKYFYKVLIKDLEDRPKFKSIKDSYIMPKYKEALDNLRAGDFSLPYFITESGKVFVYVSDLKIYIIPTIYDVDEIMNEIRESDLDLSNWYLLYENSNNPYIMNTYLKPAKWSGSLDKGYGQGTYKIVNTFENFVIEFSIYTKIDYWIRSYIGFDDMIKTDSLSDDNILKKKQLIEFILVEKGNNYIIDEKKSKSC